MLQLHHSINISGLKRENYSIDRSKEREKKKKKKIIVVNNFFCENNIFICDKIRESIPTYSDKFEILTSAISITPQDLASDSDSDSDSDLESSSSSSSREKKDLYLLEYYYNEEELFGLFEIKKNSKIIIHTYQTLLRHLLLLQQANIVHFNINYETICFTKNTQQVLIRDWTNAIHTKQHRPYIMTNNIKNEIVTNSPVEIYVLHYLIRENLQTLNVESIEIICKKYVDNPYLSFIGATSKEKLYLNSIHFLKQWLSTPREKIMDEIMKYSHTWDNYALTIIYLHMVSSFKHGFFRDFFRFLNTTLLKKHGIQETIDAFDSFLFFASF